MLHHELLWLSRTGATNSMSSLRHERAIVRCDYRLGVDQELVPLPSWQVALQQSLPPCGQAPSIVCVPLFWLSRTDSFEEEACVVKTHVSNSAFVLKRTRSTKMMKNASMTFSGHGRELLVFRGYVCN